jgi:hypothetical protein
MNEELTNEVLEAMTKCKLDCTLCGANAVCAKYDWQDTIQTLATALLEERAKPKVWDGAPEWAKSAIVIWSDTCKNEPANRRDYSPRYTRELPKTRIDEIADEVWHEINKGVTGSPKDIIKRGLKKYAEELGEK